jgi:hypothetical protein
MRFALLALLALLAAAPLQAQTGLLSPLSAPGFPIHQRPGIDLDGPVAMIDEDSLQPMTQIEYPARAWLEAEFCLEQQGVPVDFQAPQPPLFVVDSLAAAIRVHDITLDSLDGPSGFSYPTDAYTLAHSGRVIVVKRYAHNIPLLRHEAIHWILWHAKWSRQGETYGHPPEYFIPCDRYYEERKEAQR